MNDGEHMTQGRIQKALSGFYYVNTGSELLTCRARGKFRYQKITPLVGDRVVIARQPDGVADRLRDALWARPQSVLLCGAPGSGKTTLLRDLIRQLSDRFGWRICVVDERLELAACASGVPQFRLGARTDVLSGAPKAAGIELLLRTMNPEWIAVDEITAEADIAAIRRASYCGVRFLATAHAADRRELESRPLYRALLEDGFFRMAAFLLPDRSVRIERGLDHA